MKNNKLKGQILHRGSTMINVPMSIKWNDFDRSDQTALWDCVEDLQEENAKLREEVARLENQRQTAIDSWNHEAKKCNEAEAERDSLVAFANELHCAVLAKNYPVCKALLDEKLPDISNKRDIEQQIKALEGFSEKYCDDEHSFLADKACEQLRKELEK